MQVMLVKKDINISLSKTLAFFSSFSMVWNGYRRHPGKAGLLWAQGHNCWRRTRGSGEPEEHSPISDLQRGLWKHGYPWCSPGVEEPHHVWPERQPALHSFPHTRHAPLHPNGQRQELLQSAHHTVRHGWGRIQIWGRLQNGMWMMMT